MTISLMRMNLKTDKTEKKIDKGKLITKMIYCRLPVHFGHFQLKFN